MSAAKMVADSTQGDFDEPKKKRKKKKENMKKKSKKLKKRESRKRKVCIITVKPSVKI
jgi:hypothetical protein